MKLSLCFLFALLLALPVASQAQTMVIARPTADTNGQAVFVVTEVLRVEGDWQIPPHAGQVLYPKRPVRAFPLNRFGEAVLITLPIANNMQAWQGMHVHDGLIPARGGIAMTDVIEEIQQLPEPARAANPMLAAEARKPKLCPICKTYHLHHIGS